MMAREVVKEHRKFGVVTALKHFPGHGSSKEDTHFGIADVTNTWSERELEPFKRLIKEGYADGVMTSHIVNKKLDASGLPGTLSKDILDGILRKKLGYNGVVFSDDMQMHAISKNYGLEETVRLAINAGVDIMCFSNNIQGSDVRTVDIVHGLIRQMVTKGEITPKRIDESYRRIIQLKGKLNTESVDEYRAEIARLQNEVGKLNEQLKSAAVNNEPATDTKKNKRKKKTKS
jgi:beta-N-acetylhexosaminidase